MKAIVFDSPGDESILRIGEVTDPSPADHEVLIDVHATAINRADLLQRRGLYPPPPDAPEILGLECSGVIAGAGESSKFAKGDRVMAILPGGGYAERVAIDERCVFSIPEGLSFSEAAAIPETYLTAVLNIFLLGGAGAGDKVLVHGGSGGVGTAAIRLCHEADMTIYVTAGSPERAERCVDLGADAGISYADEDWAERVHELTDGTGLDIILDPVGAPYLEK
ncbi:MAG: NAD(P)H-quinone oxidoreductase, partial [Thermoanaerobaculia bacterium]|nr:NAD(P)H-quinone oxidoreductase [Thermoanaerobaculia bacterium]